MVHRFLHQPDGQVLIFNGEFFGAGGGFAVQSPGDIAVANNLHPFGGKEGDHGSDFNCQSKCNSHYAFTLAGTTGPVLLQLLWHGPERPFH